VYVAEGKREIETPYVLIQSFIQLTQANNVLTWNTKHSVRNG